MEKNAEEARNNKRNKYLESPRNHENGRRSSRARRTGSNRPGETTEQFILRRRDSRAMNSEQVVS